MTKENETALIALIGKAVVSNLRFSGMANSTYGVHDLMHTCSLTTLDNMYQSLVKQKEREQKGSLASISGKIGNARKVNDITRKIELLQGIYQFRVDENTRLEEAKATRENAAKRTTLLEGIRDQKKLEKFQNMTLEEIEAEIAKVEA